MSNHDQAPPPPPPPPARTEEELQAKAREFLGMFTPDPLPAEAMARVAGITQQAGLGKAATGRITPPRGAPYHELMSGIQAVDRLVEQLGALIDELEGQGTPTMEVEPQEMPDLPFAEIYQASGARLQDIAVRGGEYLGRLRTMLLGG